MLTRAAAAAPRGVAMFMGWGRTRALAAMRAAVVPQVVWTRAATSSRLPNLQWLRYRPTRPPRKICTQTVKMTAIPMRRQSRPTTSKSRLTRMANTIEVVHATESRLPFTTTLQRVILTMRRPNSDSGRRCRSGTTAMGNGTAALSAGP